MSRAFLLFLSLMLAAGVAFAQITIGPEDLPSPGSMNTNYEVYSVPTPMGSAGANQTWSVPAQSNWAVDYSYFLDPSTTPYAASFPSATTAEVHHDLFDSYIYYRVASDGYYMLGFADEGAQDTSITVLDQEALLAPLPATYGADWTRIMRFSSERIPGLIMTHTDSTVIIVDGWGTISSEFGTWNVLRFQEHHFSITDTNGFVVETTEEWEYNWRSQSMQTVNMTDDPDGSDPNFTSGDIFVDMLSPQSAPPARGPAASSFAIRQNYPNPFNPTTILPIELDQSAEVTVSVFDETGRLVSAQKMNLGPGSRQLPIDGSSWATGTYFVRVTEGQHTVSAKMQLIK